MRRDDGQMMVSLILALCLCLLLFLVYAMVPLGAATNEKSRSRTAADAAALAGAGAVAAQWMSGSPFQDLVYPLPPLPSGMAGSGSSAARSFASANGARVTFYQFDPALGEVYVRVENKSSYDPDGGFATSEATAAIGIGIDVTGCSWPDPAPPPPPSDGGPAVFDRTLRCVGWSASYRIANTPPVFTVVASNRSGTRQDGVGDLEPQLIR